MYSNEKKIVLRRALFRGKRGFLFSSLMYGYTSIISARDPLLTKKSRLPGL